jgi:hypothetical protein
MINYNSIQQGVKPIGTLEYETDDLFYLEERYDAKLIQPFLAEHRLFLELLF